MPKKTKVATENAAARKHNRVNVDGVEYRSVAAAFQALGLPMGKHVAFRKKLKAAGNDEFEHEGKAYKFSIVE